MDFPDNISDPLPVNLPLDEEKYHEYLEFTIIKTKGKPSLERK